MSSISSTSRMRRFFSTTTTTTTTTATTLPAASATLGPLFNIVVDQSFCSTLTSRAGHLSGDILDLFGYVLEESTSTICWVSTFFTSKFIFRDGDFAEVDAWYAKGERNEQLVQLLAKAIWFFPINVGDHWVLGIVRHTENIVSVYDPLGYEARGLGMRRKLYANLQALHVHMSSNASMLDEQQIRPSPKQNNSHDCGVYVAMVASDVSRGNSPQEHYDGPASRHAIQEVITLRERDMTKPRRRQALIGWTA